MNNEVTCLHLWKTWYTHEPDSKYVIEAQERISHYSRQDWITMSEEATVMIEDLGNNIKANSEELSEQDFDRFCAHLKDWFFEVDEVIIDKLAFSAMFDQDYISFLNKYGDGLNLYLYRMCKKYSYKLAGTK
jgi:hypothetical protein